MQPLVSASSAVSGVATGHGSAGRLRALLCTDGRCCSRMAGAACTGVGFRIVPGTTAHQCSRRHPQAFLDHLLNNSAGSPSALQVAAMGTLTNLATNEARRLSINKCGGVNIIVDVLRVCPLEFHGCPSVPLSQRAVHASTFQFPYPSPSGQPRRPCLSERAPARFRRNRLTYLQTLSFKPCMARFSCSRWGFCSHSCE